MPAVVKSCGHSCERGEGQGVESGLCCICGNKSRGEGGAIVPTGQDTTRECQLCARYGHYVCYS